MAGDKHVVAPNREADHRDRHAAPGDKFVAEQILAGETGDDLADHAHARQDHDVNGRMRVEPEHVLESAAGHRRGGIEHSNVEDALEAISSSVIASTGVASTMITLVEYIDQMNIGRRYQVIPGARSRSW